jgi:diguanylate cyclase (GGDEF)-like protein
MKKHKDSYQALLCKNNNNILDLDVTKIMLEYIAREDDNEIHNQLMLDLVSKYVEVTKQLQVKIKEIELISNTDPLTKIYNRLKFNQAFSDQLEKYTQYHHGFAVIMLDIDHFKKINDTYGHDIGDKTLIALTQVVSENIRKTDIFARWGGEEFIIIMVDTNKTDAVNAAEQIRQAIESTEFEAVKKITCSFGVTTIQPLDTILTATKRADNALYAAKQKGRNRVENQ